MERGDISALAGQRTLTGIDRFNETRKNDYSGDEEVEVCRIVLDGVVYEFVEDPSDGYRSGHYGPTVVDAVVKNTFPGLPVVCQYVEKSDSVYSGGEADILRIIHAATGKVILNVGTDDIDDYYPSWVCDFSAENAGIVEGE